MRPHRLWLWLVPVALIVAGADLLVLTSHRGAGRPAGAPVLPVAAPLMPDAVARDARPDIADYNTMVVMRDALARDMRLIVRTIGGCERAVPDPYGRGLSGLNQCLSVLLHQNLMRSRVGPVMLMGAVRDLAPGRCAELASGLLRVLSALGDTSYAWIGDIENPSRRQGTAEQADAVSMRRISRSAARLAAEPGWSTACRPRPYSATEHQGASRPRPGRPRQRVSVVA